jgi:FtsX extracellular domain
MSSSHIREALAELGQDVAELQLSPPHAIRARAESRRRRRVVGAIAAVAVGAAVTGAVALPLLRSASAPGRSLSPGAAATASTQPTASGAPTATLGVCEAPTETPAKAAPSASNDPAVASSRTVKVFLTGNHTAAERAAVESRLRTLTVVTAVEFISHEQAYREFAQHFCQAPDLVAATKPESLPESVVVTIRDPGDFPAVAKAVGAMPGVVDVVHVPV